jgi:hypothetical protein
MMEREKVLVYKSRFKWIFISGFICGTVLGTGILYLWRL